MVLQFTVSITLIASTGVIYHQLMFVKDRPVGYSREGLLMMEKKGKEFYDKFETLRTELKRSPLILGVTASGQRLGENFHQSGFTHSPGVTCPFI